MVVPEVLNLHADHPQRGTKGHQRAWPTAWAHARGGIGFEGERRDPDERPFAMITGLAHHFKRGNVDSCNRTQGSDWAGWLVINEDQNG